MYFMFRGRQKRAKMFLLQTAERRVEADKRSSLKQWFSLPAVKLC